MVAGLGGPPLPMPAIERPYDMSLLKKLLEKQKGRPKENISTREVIDNLRHLSEAEKNIADFYRLCADVRPGEKDFWLSMAESEEGHASSVQKMASLIIKEPKRYKAGYPFNAASIRVFSLYVQGLVKKMRSGEITGKEIIAIAADVESSAVELHYGEIVETDVKEYLALARQIADETNRHQTVFADLTKEKGQTVRSSTSS